MGRGRMRLPNPVTTPSFPVAPRRDGHGRAARPDVACHVCDVPSGGTKPAIEAQARCRPTMCIRHDVGMPCKGVATCKT